ncbi:flagellar hook-length control protein FliK [Selenomonas ruminantium]|uniref:flagellar hook-length control protein FliK n=1 Tax=Selenomonas ruminantium TaxID=971 RepID=UPI0003FF637D|nr:flagellar hook-length control protein FliK [Selenomonas ruminantium]
MNAANVMAISPKAGAVNKVQLTRTVGKLGKASANMTSDSFDEAMGKAGEEVSGKMAKSPVEAQGSIQGKVNAKEADIKDDMPEGTEAAFLQKQQGRKPQMTKEGKTNTQEAKVNEEEPGEPGEQDAGTATASAAVLNFTTEGKASLVMDDTTEQTESVEPAAGVNLQRLLPQSGDDVQKNKNFLAMLSGQQIKPLQAQGATPNQQTNSGQEILQRIKPATMLEAQLNNHQLANQTIQPDLGLGKSMGSNLTQQSNLLRPQLGDMQQNKQAEGLTQVNRPAGVQEAVSAEAVLNKPQPMAAFFTQNLRADQSNQTQQSNQPGIQFNLPQQSNQLRTQSNLLRPQLGDMQQDKQAESLMQVNRPAGVQEAVSAEAVLNTPQPMATSFTQNLRADQSNQTQQSNQPGTQSNLPQQSNQLRTQSNLTQQSNLLRPQLGDMQQNKQAEGLTQVNRPAGVQEAVSAEAVLNTPQPMATSFTQNLRADQSNQTQQSNQLRTQSDLMQQSNLLRPQLGDMQQDKQAEGLTQVGVQATVSSDEVLNAPQPLEPAFTQNLRADQSNLTQQTNQLRTQFNLTQQVGDMQQNKQAEGLTQQSNQSTPLEAQLSSIQQNKQAADSMLAGNWAERGLSAQDRIINPQAAALDNGKERHDAKGVALFGQSEETMPSMSAGRVNDSVTLQETGRVIVPEGNTQAQPRKENDARLVNNPLMGAGRVVEDDGQMVNPFMNMQDNSRQDLFRQNQPPVPPTIEIVTNEDGEEVSQLAEEAVGDKAPQTDSARAANEPLSMFQQSLNENLTGIKRAEAANQPQNLQNDFDVPRQIVEQARLLRRGEDTQMVIKLHPDHLGELTLKVSVSANGAVNASFHSDNAQVRAIIENTLVQLKQELNNQGLKVDNVDVYAGLTDGQLPQGEGQQAWQQNQGHNSNSSVRNLGNMEDYGEETENIAVSSPSNTDASDGVDYRV